MSVTAEDIIDSFQVFDITLVDEEITNQLIDMAVLFNMDADSLVNEWLAYQSRNQQCELESMHIDQFQKELKMSRSKQQQKSDFAVPKGTPSKSVYSHENISQAFMSPAQDILEAYCSPANKKQLKNVQAHISPTSNLQPKKHATPSSTLASPLQVTPSPKYSGRTNSGEIVAQLCADSSSVPIHEILKERKAQKNVNLSVTNSLSHKSFKYMFQKLADMCDYVNDAIEETGEKLQQHFNLDQYSPCATPSQSQVVTLGRIASETGGRLHPQSVVLEGDRVHSFGRRVTLDLQELPHYSLYPGQIVAVKGTNPTGQKFIANEVYSLPCAKGNVELQTSAFEDCIHIMIAVGPFSTSSLSYEPLKDFISAVQKNKPDVTIVVGPIVDANQSSLTQSNDIESFEEFAEKWINYITSSLQSITTLVFVPSTRDVFHHFSYPQPPYKESNSQNVYHVSDPVTFDLPNVRIGVTSTDVLFHLGAEEISKNPNSDLDRLSRLSQHMLCHRSYYPLYPPHENVPFDLINSEFGAKMPNDGLPDILIVPSDLRCFAKCVKGHVCLNPGRLTKGETGGTYAQVLIEDGDNGRKNVHAEVVKI